jgi:hypothetical protein
VIVTLSRRMAAQNEFSFGEHWCRVLQRDMWLRQRKSTIQSEISQGSLQLFGLH